MYHEVFSKQNLEIAGKEFDLIFLMVFQIEELLCYFFKNIKCIVFGLSKKLSF